MPQGIFGYERLHKKIIVLRGSLAALLSLSRWAARVLLPSGPCEAGQCKFDLRGDSKFTGIQSSSSKNDEWRTAV
jgi:hypothetical protein